MTTLTSLIILRRKAFALWLFVFSATFLALYISNWYPIRISGWGVEQYPGDLRVILGFADCIPEYGRLVFDNSNNGPNCAGYGYGYTLIWVLNHLGLGMPQLQLLTSIFTLLLLTFLVANSFIIYVDSRMNSIALFLLFCSPLVWMLLSSLNFDILIYILLFAALILENQGKSLYATTLVAISAMLKYFTLPLLYFLLFRYIFSIQKRVPQKITVLLIVLFVTLIAATDASYVDWNGTLFAEGIFNVFGILSSANWIELLIQQVWSQDIVFTELFKYILSYSLFLFGFILFLVLILKQKVFFRPIFSLYSSEIHSKGFNPKLNIIFYGIPFLSLYLADLNYDQKLIFLSFAISPLLQLQRKTFKYSLYVLMFCSFWFTLFYPKNFSFFAFNLTQLLGDITLIILTFFMLLMVIVTVFSESPFKLFPKYFIKKFGLI